MKRSLIAAAAVVLLAGAARAAEDDHGLSERRTPVVRAVEQAAPSVVNISTTQIRTVQMMPQFWSDLPDVFKQEFGDLFRPRRQVSNSLGSGVIISPKGYIVTNAHVVQRADEIVVTLADESQLKAELVSADPEADLAVIKVTTDKPLKAVRIGTSSDLMIGETVIAVGNPFGYQHTVTTGVVSALDRTIEPAEGVQYKGLIQTDAPINPGNSGGPLLNIRGELIGINTAIRAGAQGLGFAIPVDRVREIMVDLLSLRRTGRAWLGLRLKPEAAAGIVVAAVERDSPAAKAHIVAGDLIESLDGRPVTDPVDFETLVLDHKSGETLRLGLKRGEEPIAVRVTLAEAPKPDGSKLAKAMFGLDLQALTPALAQSLHLTVQRGLLVAGVAPQSPADSVGFKEGDVLVQVGRYSVADLDGLGLVLVQVEKGDSVLFYIVRGSALLRTVLESKAGSQDTH